MKLVIHPPVEDERLAKITAAAGSMAVINALDAAEAAARDRRCRRVLRQAYAGTAGRQPTVALGAIADGQPGALHLSGTGRSPRGADQYARLVLRRDRRSGAGLHPLLRSQLAPLHSQSAHARWAPVGGKCSGELYRRPGTVGDIDRAHMHLADARWGSSGWGRSVRRSPDARWPSACESWPSIRCRRRRRKG